MNNNWYRPSDSSSWYAPLARTGNSKTARARKGLSGPRRAGLICTVAVLSAALLFSVFGRHATVTVETFSSNGTPGGKVEEDRDFPDSFNDFFASYYTAVTTDEADVNIPKATFEEDFSFKLEKAEGDEISLQELYSRCAPAIVGIAGYEDEKAGYNWGTGVVISSDGLILTNTHVIDGCDSADVIFSPDEKYKASLIGADAASDIALLRIEASGLQTAHFGSSAEINVGDRVCAIGNPLGDTFTRTLTDGIVSAISRDVAYNGRSMTLLQTNTALNEGNSGGALFNMHGQVIGITNMKMMSSFSSIEGIGFAIPSATVEEIVSALIKDGEVRGRPSIGITVGQIPENVSLHYSLPEGLYVVSVSKGSDAEKQGIKEGDVVTAVNGSPVRTTKDITDVKDKLSVGDEMTFTVFRDGSTFDVTIALMDTKDIYG